MKVILAAWCVGPQDSIAEEYGHAWKTALLLFPLHHRSVNHLVSLSCGITHISLSLSPSPRWDYAVGVDSRQEIAGYVHYWSKVININLHISSLSPSLLPPLLPPLAPLLPPFTLPPPPSPPSPHPSPSPSPLAWLWQPSLRASPS